IDTVKQAELFAAIREHYDIPRRDNVSLKDYPTIRHCIKFVLSEKGGSSAPAPSAAAPAAQPVQTAPAPQPVTAPAAAASAGGVDEESVKTRILDMITEKTGYPKDMLELDLDMEADLGIDTVKQAELFAAIREHYDIPRRDDVSLKDYPTIRHCIKFVLDEKGGTAAPAAAPAPQAAPAAQPAPAAAPAPQQELPFDEEPRAEYPKRHIRHIPVIAPAPVEQEIIRKYSSSRPVLIMASDLALAKAYRAELSKHRIDSHIFISEKTRLKDSRTLDWADTAAVDKALQDFAAAHPDTQGLVYLLGCAEKKFAPASTDAYADFNRFTVPLFLAAKHLFKPLGAVEPGMSTFLAVVTRLDGGFGYRTDQVYDPIYGAIHGVTLCLRKELEKTTVKLIDFAAGSPTEALVQKTFYELLYGDKRLAIGYDGARRSTMLAKPELLDYSRERTPLKGKKIIVTGGGRGLGSLFAKILARRWKPELILMDIIELGAGIERFAAMTEDQLKAYKNS
ncbi:MAG TPA: phosphopantetheine-binding protein, partial [Elusimicrobiales bacterium]|nr:phosphopantetheine-binding protein [Elusimicrobiales bacterium]